MKRIFLTLIGTLALFGCDMRDQIDLLVVNATVYTVDDQFNTSEAIAIRNGEFVEVGTSEELRNKYNPQEILDAKGKAVLPGFIDAHAHFYGFGMQLQTVNLTGTKSFEEVVSRIIAFQERENSAFILGRGWDQNDWEIKEFPKKDTLDILFPDTPVSLTRIDGHALLANQAALDLAGITGQTSVRGGEIILENGSPTGILVDNPMGLVQRHIPSSTTERKIEALLDAQEVVFSYGLTTINDAGIDRSTVELIDSLQQNGDLKVRIYAMLRNSKSNLDYYLDRGIYKTDHLNVRSVKVMSDGALGSRGAAMKEPYSDQKDQYGALLSSVEQFQETAARIARSDFQMNTHAIGDSANVVILKIYDSILQGQADRRWKVEHAQIIDEQDFQYFNENIIPSVQPTHATSDMYWVRDRIGEDREEGAYAFKRLLDQAGIVALGTDFPVEEVSPFLTFYAAVARKDIQGWPSKGYRIDQALSREETLRGMTIWAAYSNFEEEEKGSIEAGKFADFIILDKDIMQISEDEIPSVKVEATFVAGEKVY